MLAHAKDMKPDCYVVPADIDNEIARVKLETLGVTIDTLTDEQIKYMNSWEMGTV